MRILVERRGFGRLKPPDGLDKFKQLSDNVMVTTEEWNKWNRDNPKIIAINCVGEWLEPGVYEASLTYQYYSNMADCWFSTKDPRKYLSQNIPVRLVYTKVYNIPEVTQERYNAVSSGQVEVSE